MTKSLKYLGVALLIAVAIQLNAQAPQGINYQSVARNGAGIILTNQTVSVRFTIRDGGSTGSVIYRENHTVLTNQFGTFSVVVGNGVPTVGSFSGIGWGLGAKYLQVEMDFSGGTTYSDMGTSQLMSVPYALYANGSKGDVTSVKYDTTGIINILNVGGSTITSTKGSWLTTGNGGLSAATNFIGTTDNTNLIFKRGGIEGLRMTAGGALLATGNAATGVTPTSGAGKRMMWIPAKAAFRVGNGTSATNRNNALTVTKKGQVNASQLFISQALSLQDTTYYLTGSSLIAVENKSYIKISSTAGPSVSIITLGPGVRSGQLLIVQCAYSGTNNGIKFVDAPAANRTNLNASSIDMMDSDIITFIWDSVAYQWIQIGYSKNS